MTGPSLEKNLSRLTVALLLLVLLALLAIGVWIARESAIQFALSRLHHDAEAIISRLDPERKTIGEGLAPIYRQPLSGHYYLVRFDDGSELRSRSLWDAPFATPASFPGKPRYWLMPGPNRQQLLVWQQHFQKNGQDFSIAIAEDVAPLLKSIWRFLWLGVIASLVVVLLMLLAQRWLIRRAFLPLDRVQEQLREIHHGRREHVDTALPGEIAPVVNEFNQLLGNWKQHHERAHNAVGNLAHALKTPLQLILSEARKNHLDDIERQAGKMQSLIEQELKRARLSGHVVAGRHFSARHDLEALLETLSALHRDKNLRFDLFVTAPERLRLDQDDMMELAGNLLDNAAKWAKNSVRVRLEADRKKLGLTVEDDGPGIDPDHRQDLLGRGSRLDENLPGHGLGLAIVSDIVALYDGRIELDTSSDLGGLKVVVSLPVAAS